MSTSWTVSEKPGRYHLRLSLNERLQHLLMMVSIFTLIITGMPVRFHNVPTADLVVRWMGGNPMRATLHRTAAVLLLLLACYHLLYVLVSRRGRDQLRALMPKRRDGHDAWHMLKYYVGLAPEKPSFARFSYIEKFEYLAVVWGVVVMGITGLMLWFPATTMVLLPKWSLDVARVMHSYEALLAFISIILWHFYNVHFNPSIFPMSTTWIDGLISEERMRDEHLLEYVEVEDQTEEWVLVQPAFFAPPAAEVAGGRVPVKAISVFASAWGGCLAGAAALVPALPLLALCAWLLNPEENGWSIALRLGSLLVVPSCAAGAGLSVLMSLKGQGAGRSVFAGLTTILGFYLSVLSLWLVLAAGLYVLHWFFPFLHITAPIATALLVVSLLPGLAMAIWTARHGHVKAQSLFSRKRAPEGRDTPSGQPPLDGDAGENTRHRQGGEGEG